MPPTWGKSNPPADGDWEANPAPANPAWTQHAAPTRPTAWDDDGAAQLLLTPELHVVHPLTGGQSATVSVALAGRYFTPDATIQVSGSGVTVSGVQVLDSYSILATFTIAVAAATTVRTVTVTTAGGVSNTVNFEVTAGDITDDSRLVFRWDMSQETGTDGVGMFPTDLGYNLTGILKNMGGAVLGAPVFRSDTWEAGTSKRCLEFAGTHGMQGQTKLALTSPSDFTVFVVYKGPSSNVPTAYVYYYGDVLGNPLQAIANDSPVIYTRRAGPPGTVSAKVATPTDWNSDDGTRRVLRHEYDGTHAGHLIYDQNGVFTLGDSTIGNPGTTANPAAAERIVFGCRTDSTTLALTGWIAEFRLYMPKLTTAEIALVQAALEAKWL